MTELSQTLTELSRTYVELHTRKEELFWAVKMGLGEDTRSQRELAEAEIAVNRFLQDPQRLAALRDCERHDGTEEERKILEGWIAMLSANVVEQAEGRKLSEEIVELEAALEHRRMEMPLGYVDPATGRPERASSNKLALMMRTDPDERVRRAAFQGIRSIEPYVLDAGFLDIVRRRNRLARMLGYEDYYDWRVSVVERMSKRRLFEILDDLAARTAPKAREEIGAFEKKHGAGSLDPWNFGFLRAGELTRELDPYFGFAEALGRWMRSFTALGVRYRGATLTLDLVDRDGKYENGFMHGPGLAFFEQGVWSPARINFTANAVPGQSGSGLRATETLFHEGGHAAHFSNILANAPCFSQEFAPTSVAYAETQSMFMDSMLDDPDWRVRYAQDAHGTPMPLELIEHAIRETQPLRAWDVRALLTVPFAERVIYEIPDAELTPARVLAELRRVEHELQFLSSGMRPVLAVPHLLAGESSAYYHGYVLAEMAVFQTREHFLRRDGHLVDNPRIGPDLARHYWAPGNAVAFDETIRSLTGKSLSADALVAASTLDADTACANARSAVARMTEVPRHDGSVDLEATVRVIHGRELVATTADGGPDAACRAFTGWIQRLEGNTPA